MAKATIIHGFLGVGKSTFSRKLEKETGATRLNVDEACMKASSWGASFEHIYLYAPDDVLKERISKRTGAIATYNLENFDQIRQSFQPPFPDEKALTVPNF